MSRRSGNESEQVLQAYLDELLSAPEETPAAPYADEVAERERLQKLLYSAAPRPATAKRIAPPVVVEPDPSAPVETPQETPVPPPVETVPGPEEVEEASPVFRMKDIEWRANGRPAWAQERFDVLLFSVSGLTLAVPLVALGQIHPLTDELTPIFGQVDWFMGMMPTPAGRVRTVNTARFVMPERYDPRFEKTAQYVISIDGVPWGLAVDSVNQPITLDPEDVKWRTERSRRPWLAGTVKEQMCALLDIPRVGQLLMAADRKR